MDGITAEDTAKAFYLHVWKDHGLPISTISDRGTQFESHFWDELCQRCGTTASLSMAFHPETDGQTENANAVMEQYKRLVPPNPHQRPTNSTVFRTSIFQLMPLIDHRLPGLRISLSSEPPKLCGFLSIPRELRDMLYSELIVSGHILILRVSQQVHDETKDCLHKQGICRLQFHHRGEYFNSINPPKSSLSKVQNFDIKIYIDCDVNYVGSLD